MLIFFISAPVLAANAQYLDLYPSTGDIFSNIFILPQAKAIVVVLIMLGIFSEIKIAGSGFGAIIALVGVGLLFGADFSNGILNYYEILFFVLGLVLLVLEIFIPGFGIFGILGICSILLSFYYILGAGVVGAQWLALSIVIAIAIAAVLVKYLPSNPAWKLFVLKDKQVDKNNKNDENVDYQKYLGKKGIALTVLRPAGRAIIDGVKLDVLTKGEFIEEGSKIVVSKVSGVKIFVETF
jgi:membrane-bound serine protease (ClpP class)